MYTDLYKQPSNKQKKVCVEKIFLSSCSKKVSMFSASLDLLYTTSIKEVELKNRKEFKLLKMVGLPKETTCLSREWPRWKRKPIS